MLKEKIYTAEQLRSALKNSKKIKLYFYRIEQHVLKRWYDNNSNFLLLVQCTTYIIFIIRNSFKPSY